MNEIPIGLCERENYVRTLKILKKGKRGPLHQPDSFIKSKKKENAKPKSKLSFDVSVFIFRY